MQRESRILKPVPWESHLQILSHWPTLRVLVGQLMSCVGFRRNGLKMYSGAVEHIPRSLRQEFHIWGHTWK